MKKKQKKVKSDLFELDTIRIARQGAVVNWATELIFRNLEYHIKLFYCSVLKTSEYQIYELQTRFFKRYLERTYPS